MSSSVVEHHNRDPSSSLLLEMLVSEPLCCQSLWYARACTLLFIDSCLQSGKNVHGKAWKDAAWSWEDEMSEENLWVDRCSFKAEKLVGRDRQCHFYFKKSNSCASLYRYCTLLVYDFRPPVFELHCHESWPCLYTCLHLPRKYAPCCS